MSFEDLLKSLQAEYLATLPTKIEVILKQIQDTSLHDLRESFHKLKGTGTTYGLPEVTELAETLEDICTDLPDLAADAARRGAELLRAIYDAHSDVGSEAKEFNLAGDPRYTEVRALLSR